MYMNSQKKEKQDKERINISSHAQSKMIKISESDRDFKAPIIIMLNDTALAINEKYFSRTEK